jgi:hypothetical protein
MKSRVLRIFTLTVMTLSLALAPLTGYAQNNNTAKGEVKQSGKEVGRAGRSMGRNVKHGRILRGGKHFGKHMGRAGKHFGRSTKKTVKHVIS